MFLTWIILGMAVAAAGAIIVTVIITATVIRDLMQNDSSMNKSLSATIEKKLKDDNHTVIRVKLKDYNGNTTTQEIKSDKGATVYEGQIIFK